MPNFSLASATCSLKNCRNALTLIFVASTTSPFVENQFIFQHLCTVPSSPTNSMRPFPAACSVIVADFSLPKKSPPVICATWVLESFVHLPIRCGFFLAYCLTDAEARRSELPCRNTGLTALPFTLSYLALMSFSSSFFGSSG